MSTTDQAVPVGMSRGMTLRFAITGGVAVGNRYWAQTLMEGIADSLGVSPPDVSLLVTLTKIGYAVGIALLVSLGYTLDRRRLIHVVMLCSCVALVACADFRRAADDRDGLAADPA